MTRHTTGLHGDSELPAELIAAYQSTDFRVQAAPDFTLRIGVASADLRAVYADLRISSAAFLTAWNPFSQPTSQSENDAAQAELIRILGERGYAAWNGIGVDPSGHWPGEDSVFVPGIGREEAMELGNKFAQNAVVWADADAVARLLLLR